MFKSFLDFEHSRLLFFGMLFFWVPKQCFHARVWKGLQSPEGFALKLLDGYGHDMS